MKKILLFGAVLLSVTATFSSHAATLITNDTTAITSTAQSYNTSVVLGTTQYSNVTLNLTAKGDYGRASDKNIIFKIDDVTLAD